MVYILYIFISLGVHGLSLFRFGAVKSHLAFVIFQPNYLDNYHLSLLDGDIRPKPISLVSPAGSVWSMVEVQWSNYLLWAVAVAFDWESIPKDLFIETFYIAPFGIENLYGRSSMIKLCLVCIQLGKNSYSTLFTVQRSFSTFLSRIDWFLSDFLGVFLVKFLIKLYWAAVAFHWE